jgi:uncharacterized alkaline shock family protein YloU
MKLIHRIAGFIVLTSVVATGGILVASARSGARWSDLAAVLVGNRPLAAGIGIALLLLAVIYLLSGIPRRKQQKYLSFDGEGGTVSISTEAIADYVARLAGEFPTIVRMKPEVIPARNTIDIHVYIQIKDGPEIHEACELLQKRIREVLAGSLGINDVRKVEVSVREIIAEFNPD